MIYQPKNVYLIKNTEKKKEIIIKKSQCTILLYYPIERKKKYARICSVNVHVTICPLIYIPCVHMPPIIIPPFDIPREYIWKKRNYPSDIFEFIFSKFIVFFLIFVYLLSLSVSYFFSKLFKKKEVIFGGPTKYTKKFLHSGIVSTVFCLIPEKTKRKIIYLEHCLFLVSHLFVSPQPHIISSSKKIWKYSIPKYIRENHLL